MGNVGYGILFDIEGVYNIDAYVYILRSRPTMFDGYSLSAIAKSLKVTGKLDMPTMSNDTTKEDILRYIMNVCKVTAEIWLKLNIDMELLSLCLCASCSPYDACRYVTGTMMACLLTSRAIERGARIQWNPCRTRYDFEGGYVLTPVRGVHRNLFVCDFNSMYPSVMIGCNISPETIVVDTLDRTVGIGEVVWDDHMVSVGLSDCTARFPYTGTSMLKGILSDLVQERSRYKKTHHFYSLSLKVCGNSLYGAIGFESSSMYSPRCAAAVTTISRWSLRLAISCFEKRGLRVVGGDTDSCFVCSADQLEQREETAQRVRGALADMAQLISTGPLRRLTMEVEECFKAAILLQKKRYCKLRDNGELKITGMTFARKSEPGVRRRVCKLTCMAILKSVSAVDACNRVKNVLMHHVGLLMSRRATLSFIAGLKSKDGSKKYTYVSVSGALVSMPPEMTDLIITDYDPKPLLEMVGREVSSITTAAGIGSLSDCMRKSTTF